MRLLQYSFPQAVHCVGFVSLLFILSSVSSGNPLNVDNVASGDESPANIIFIMIDDLGQSDLSIYGSEWDTPNFDAFISDSITLSHHYIGYVCSASRSQFLTGRYSFHNGYGTLNVFDIQKMGAIPQNTPTIMEYLQKYGNYDTYGLGKWQLGNAVDSQLAPNRGFSQFKGFNGGIENYFTKLRERVVFPDSFIDFWDGLQVSEEYSDGYSTDQYFDEVINIVKEKAKEKENKKNNDNPFFVYAGLQANHIPFPDHSDDSTFTQYYADCVDKYEKYFDNFDTRIGVCESVLGIDAGIGKLMSYFNSNECNENSKCVKLWQNTVIIVTADNGGALDSGSCNYPLRGGKNTFFEGGQRVLTYGMLTKTFFCFFVLSLLAAVCCFFFCLQSVFVVFSVFLFRCVLCEILLPFHYLEWKTVIFMFTTLLCSRFVQC